MTNTNPPVRTDVTRIIAWAVFLPILGIWPFVSAMPLFSLIGQELSRLAISVNVLLFLSGFWPLAAAWAAFAFLRAPAPATSSGDRKRRGLYLGAYATAWTGLYAIFAMVRG